MDFAAIVTGLVAILTAAGGVVLIVREFRRRDRHDCQRDIDELEHDLRLVREDFADFRRWAFVMHQKAIDAGADVSNPPAPRPLAPVDPDGVRVGGHLFRRRRRADDGHGGAGNDG